VSGSDRVDLSVRGLVALARTVSGTAAKYNLFRAARLVGRECCWCSGCHAVAGQEGAGVSSWYGGNGPLSAMQTEMGHMT